MNGLVPATLALLMVGAEGSFTAKVERMGVPAVVAEAQRRLLEGRAVIVRAGDATVMRVWFRREIPVRATAEDLKKGVSHRQIAEGTLVGAVEVRQSFIDYRKQRIAAGVYTLRFAIQPDTGDHTDTAPHREFCLLSPAAEECSPDDLAPKALIELSSRVNHGRHPAVLLLWPNSDGDETVRVLDKGEGVQVVAVKRPVAAGGRKATIGFAFTVAGVHRY